MSEIRDKVEKEIAEIIRYADTSDNPVLIPNSLKSDYLKAANQILSIPELAIVDREAELPEVPWQTGFGTMKRNVYRKAQQDMLKAGWVKEVEK